MRRKPTLAEYRHSPPDLALPLAAASAWDGVVSDLRFFRDLCMTVGQPVVVRVLRPYAPSEAERADAGLYAGNVRKLVDGEYAKLHRELHGW